MAASVAGVGCLPGWVSSISRIAYAVGLALADALLKTSPTVAGFWLAARLVVLVLVGSVWLADPMDSLETCRRDLEEIEMVR
jgi:hypothetical protein